MENNENSKKNPKNNLNNIQPNAQQNNKIKKKHTFLKLLIILLVLFLAYKGVRYLGNSFAEKQLNLFMSEYPFSFNENDSYKAITENFEAKNVFKLNNKEYKIKWISNNDCIKFNENIASVNNTSSQNQEVKISANYSILGGIGKATRTYDVTVLTKNKISLNDVNVVSVDSVKNKSYNREMKMTLSPTGNVASMYGDFKQSIYTQDDCYTVLKAYKNNLKIDPSCDFNLCDIIYGNETTTYIYYLTINKYNIEDKKIYISVNNNDNYSIESIKCNFDRDISKYPIAKPQSDNNIYKLLSSTYERTKANTIFTYNKYGYQTIDNKIYLVGDYVMFYDNDEIHEVYVDIINGKIIKEVDPSKYIAERCVMEECKGTGVMNDTKTFDAFKASVDAYYLMDSNRNIATYHTEGSYTVYKFMLKNMNWWEKKSDNSDNDFIQTIDLLAALVNFAYAESDYILTTLATSTVVKSDSQEFNDSPTAVDGYYNIISAYDYYKDHFNLISYNNKGAPILIFVDNKSAKDNACWNGLQKIFCINPVEDFKYSFAKDAEVLGHEYTHAVFGEYTDGSNIEISGLNEAYADIFGVFVKSYDNSKNKKDNWKIEENDWKIGKNIYKGSDSYIRDLTSINSPESTFSIMKNPAPEKYHDANWDSWDGEEHAICCMIGHIAYQMYSSGKFTNTELENIWYKSLTYGYGNDDTYVTCRQQILQAMNDLNGTTFNGHTFSFSPEQRNLVREFFDEAEIFDNTDTYECTSDAVDGDLMKDDTDSHRFAMAISPIGFIINKSPLYIYEECNSSSKDDVNYVQNELNNYWDSIGGNDLSNELAEYFGSRDGDAIIYKQIPTWQMNIVEWWIGKTNVKINDFLDKTLNESGISETDTNSDWITAIKQLIFTGTVDETTRYKFYDGLLNESLVNNK